MYYRVVLQTSWEAWAAAFTAIEFLHLEYGTDSTKKMANWILHEAVLNRRQIMGQGASEGQWSNAYCVLKKLQSYYELEKRREGKRPFESKHIEREKKLNDSLAQVVQATLDFAIQERQRVEASNQVFELLMLVHDLVRILETICSGAISDGLWQESAEIVRVFKAIPDDANGAEVSLKRLRRIWCRRIKMDLWKRSLLMLNMMYHRCTPHHRHPTCPDFLLFHLYTGTLSILPE